MKKTKRLGTFLMIFLCLSLFSGSTVQAQTKTFDQIHLDLTIPDEITCLTPDTSPQDPAWAAAGITDVSKEKKDFSKMGGQAYFYDSASKTLVRLLVKTSTQSQDLFNLSLLTEEERKSFYATMTSTDDDTAKFEIADFEGGELPFYRLSIKVSGTPGQQEIIYGTLVNGSMIYFDIYKEGVDAVIDESLQQTLVKGVHFTKLYTKEEFDKLRQQSLTRLLLILGGIVLAVVILVVVSKKSQKAREIEKKKKAEQLYRYYAKKKEKEKENADVKQQLLYENHTTYTQEIIKDFCTYTNFLRKLPFWITTAALYLVLFLFLLKSSGLSLQLLIITAAMIAIICYQVYRSDKTSTYLWKPYSSPDYKETVLRFYEDYFTVAGSQYSSEYPYLQITTICCHKNYIYLYLGTEQAIYLAKDGFTQGTWDECIASMKKYLAEEK